MQSSESSPRRLPTLEEIRQEQARRHLARFIERVAPDTRPAAHHRILIGKLEAVERGEISRLMIFMPPGSAKSTYASVMFPPWYMGRNADKTLIGASNTTDLAEKFGRRVRNIVGSREFYDVFGFGLAHDSKAAGEWENERGGEYKAAGVGSSIVGRRADGGLIDDPIKSREEADSETIRAKVWEWYLADFRTRLKPNAWIILIQTRWHEDDLAGRILPEAWNGETGWVTARDGERWYVLCLPAIADRADDPLGRAPGDPIWPEWFGRLSANESAWSIERARAHFEQERLTQGPRNWSALFQQRPTPETGEYFKADWLRGYERLPPELRVYGASDYAVTDGGGDYTVHIVIGLDVEGRMYVLDLWREQTDSLEWIEAFCDLVKRWKPIEWAEETGQIKAAVGPFLKRRIAERGAYVYRRQFPTKGDKAIRAQAIRGRMAERGLYLPQGAPWVPEFKRELLAFPRGKHDDQVDAIGLIGQLLDHMEAPKKPAQPAAPKVLMVGQPSTITIDEAWSQSRRDSERI